MSINWCTFTEIVYRLQTVVRKAQRSGVLSNSLKSLDELREESDETLFRSIIGITPSCPSSPLTPPKNTGHKLRPCTHNFTLQAAVTK